MVRKWMLKAAVQRAISLSPASHRLNRFMQQHVTRTTHLRQWDFDDHLRTDTIKLGYYRDRAPAGGVPTTVMEIGTGWHPILPLAMWLAGAEQVDTIDIACNLSDDQVQQTADAFRAASDDGRLAELFPPALPDRVDSLLAAPPVAAEGYRNWLARFGVRTHVGADSYANIADASVDLIISVSVLEYFDRNALRAASEHFARTLAPAGVMIHDISLADQYAFTDGSISKINFLRYSSRAWQIINNPLIPLNRLRASDYADAFDAVGLATQMLDVERLDDAEVATVPLAPEFWHYSADDIAIIRANFISTAQHAHASHDSAGESALSRA